MEARAPGPKSHLRNERTIAEIGKTPRNSKTRTNWKPLRRIMQTDNLTLSLKLEVFRLLWLLYIEVAETVAVLVLKYKYYY